MCVRIHQQILRLDVSVADTESVDVADGAEELVGVELHQYHRHQLFLLLVKLNDSRHSLRNVLHDYIEVDLLGAAALLIKCVLQRNHIRVVQLAHYVEFPILIPLIMVQFLDGHLLLGLINNRLKNDAK